MSDKEFKKVTRKESDYKKTKFLKIIKYHYGSEKDIMMIPQINNKIQKVDKVHFYFGKNIQIIFSHK